MQNYIIELNICLSPHDKNIQFFLHFLLSLTNQIDNNLPPKSKLVCIEKAYTDEADEYYRNLNQLTTPVIACALM